MKENNHKLGFKFSQYAGCCNGIQVYIDREKINSVKGFYPLDKDKRRIDDNERMDLEIEFAELEVADIRGIAQLMNEETFMKFCELWWECHQDPNRCDFASCRHNKNGQCDSIAERKVCVDVSKAVLCLGNIENEKEGTEKENQAT